MIKALWCADHGAQEKRTCRRGSNHSILWTSRTDMGSEIGDDHGPMGTFHLVIFWRRDPRCDINFVICSAVGRMDSAAFRGGGLAKTFEWKTAFSQFNP